jgi:ATP-dependent Lhr-like helicase
VALFLREHADAWCTLRAADASSDRPAPETAVGQAARRVIEALRQRGASFLPELAIACELAEAEVRAALADLVAAGLVASDGFGGLRSIVRASAGPYPGVRSGVRPGVRPDGHIPESDLRMRAGGRANVTGRWSLLGSRPVQEPDREAAIEAQARALLRRYGVVFRRLLAREANVAPWRELTRVYRRLEARGEIRGGRFVTGMSGEQFALAEAVDRLREIRRTPPDRRCIVISAADPLNLVGIVTAGERVRAVASTRVAYSDGVPMAAMEGDYVRPLIPLTDVAPGLAAEIATTLAGRPVPPVLSGFVGRS